MERSGTRNSPRMPTGSPASPGAGRGRAPRRLRLSVRLRLALLCGALAVLAGTLVLGGTYLLLTVRLAYAAGGTAQSFVFRAPVAPRPAPLAAPVLRGPLPVGAGARAHPAAVARCVRHALQTAGRLPGNAAARQATDQTARDLLGAAGPLPALESARLGNAAYVQLVRCLPPAVLAAAAADPPAGFVVAIKQSASAAQRAVDLRNVLVRGGVALALLAGLALAAGWWMAGRLLRPLQVMTNRVQQLSAQTPLGRIRLAGPDDELKDLADTFDGLLGRLDAALAAERRFVANASHELRTPLAIQETLLDVALADPQADVQSLREMAERLRQVNARSGRLMEGLLALARSQRAPDRPESEDLAALAGAAVEAVAGEAASRGIGVQTELSPAPVRGDPALLERLAGNLVENAVRHNMTGGWLRVETGGSARGSVLTVVNSGPPVDPAEVAGLFEPFRRGGRERTASARGAGLGLSIVRAVAQAHGGDADAVARPEGGLAVTVVLPPAPPEPA